MSAESGTQAPAVTLVIPCYNQSHYLRECLDSLVAQTRADWEAVVVDDTSPDGDRIAAVVEELGDARVRVLRHPKNKGLAGARNTGIGAATTPYVLPLDADDRLAPETLQVMLAALEGTPEADCVYGTVRLFGRDDRLVQFHGPAPGEKLVETARTIPGAGTMMRKVFWERVGGYDEADELRHGREDLEFWIRAFDLGAHALRVPEALYEYRQTHASMSVECRRHDHVVASYLYHKHQRIFDEHGEGKAFLAHWLQRSAYAHYSAGDRRRARELNLRAFKLMPGLEAAREVVRTSVPRSLERSLWRGDVRRAIPFLGYPLRSAARHRPFFVIGVGRSGNTLFRRILTSHSGLHVPPETFVLGEVIRKWPRNSRRMSWHDLVTFVLGQFELHPEWDTFGVLLGPLAQRLMYVSHHDRNLAFLINGIYRYLAEHQAPEKAAGMATLRWGDKTPMNSLDDAVQRGARPARPGEGTPETLERLLKVFPDAQFLRVYRDGCDVVCSHLRGGFFRDVEDAGERWLHVMRQTGNFVRRHPESCRDVRFEELVSAPEATVRGVCEFLGVEFEPDMLSSEGRAGELGDVSAWSWHENVKKPIDAGRAGRGRALLSSAERERLQRLIGAELEALGYPPATASA